jgi:hypothetical protein
MFKFWLSSASNDWRNLDSSVSIAVGYGLDRRGSIPCRGKGVSSSPQCPERFCGFLRGGKVAWAWSCSLTFFSCWRQKLWKYTSTSPYGTNDLRRSTNLDYEMGEVYALVNTAETKFSQSRLILSGVHRRRDVSLRSIGALDAIYDFIAELDW